MTWSANLAWRIEVTDTAKKQLAKLDIIRWVAGLLIAQAAIVVALVKLL